MAFSRLFFDLREIKNSRSKFTYSDHSSILKNTYIYNLKKKALQTAMGTYLREVNYEIGIEFICTF